MIHITGDTHGEPYRFLQIPGASQWTHEDILIVCGDFGYVMRDTDSEKAFLNDLEQLPYLICFVDGNHENFPLLFSFPEEEWMGGKIHRIRKNVIHLMRGQVYTVEGVTFFTMGGAYSIDRFMRKKGVSYWEEELPSNEEYNEAIRNLNRHGNRVDFILTHTAPREIIRRMGHTPDGHDMELTGFLEYVLYEVEHRHWYCGHWHRDEPVTDRFTALWFDVKTLPKGDDPA